MKVTRKRIDHTDCVVVEEAYAGAVVMPSEQGCFSIQHRDNGIEVSLDGRLFWSSTSGAFDAEPQPFPTNEERALEAWADYHEFVRAVSKAMRANRDWSRAERGRHPRAEGEVMRSASPDELHGSHMTAMLVLRKCCKIARQHGSVEDVMSYLGGFRYETELREVLDRNSRAGAPDGHEGDSKEEDPQ